MGPSSIPSSIPSSEAVRLQLERVLSSELFANAERARRFLRYVTERTLAGEGDQLKEFVIGVDVFDRDDQYDPRIDSIVRVEAGRLRAKLDQYYSRANNQEKVLIRMPRGSYVPEFELRQLGLSEVEGPALSERSDSKEPALSERSESKGRVAMGVAAALVASAVLAWGAGLWPSRDRGTPIVSIVVLPFEHFSADAGDQLLAARITDGVTSELARIRGVSVVSRTSALQLASHGKTLKEIARAVDADFVVEGSLSIQRNRIQLDVRLVDTVVDRKGWRQEFSGEPSDLRALQQQVAADVAAAAVQWRHPRSQHPPSPGS